MAAHESITRRARGAIEFVAHHACVPYRSHRGGLGIDGPIADTEPLEVPGLLGSMRRSGSGSPGTAKTLRHIGPGSPGTAGIEVTHRSEQSRGHRGEDQDRARGRHEEIGAGLTPRTWWI